MTDQPASLDRTGSAAPRVIVVVPMYNEAENLAELASRLAATSRLCEGLFSVVAVDDGSTDGSFSRAITSFNGLPGSVVIELSRNFGKEAALLAGMDEALKREFDLLILMDADLQHPPEAIPEMIARWRMGDDVVIAARRSRATDTALGRMFSRMFYKVLNRLADVSVVDGDGDFRLLARDAVEALCRLREQDRFTKGLYSWIGFRQGRILVDFDGRKSGASKFSLSRKFMLAGNAITSFSSKPLRLALVFGVLVGGISILIGLWIVLQTLIFGKDVPGYASIFCGMSFLGGVQLATIGLLGEYVGRTYIQAKGRPSYLSRSVIEVGVAPLEAAHEGQSQAPVAIK